MNSSSGVSFLSSIVTWLLGFYQDAVHGIIEMLTGGQTEGLLMWLMKSWKSLFVMLVLGGIAVNVVVYVIRWKPYWWWFAKKRMVVNDELLGKRSKARTASKKPYRAHEAKPSTIVPRKDAALSLSLSTIAPKREEGADDLFSDGTDDLLLPKTTRKR